MTTPTVTIGEAQNALRLPTPVRALAVAVALSMIVVLVAGTLVNSNRAALSVPDWPLSYGSLLVTSRWVGNIRFEQTHRLAVAIAGLVLFALLLSMKRTVGPGRIRAILVRATIGYVLQVLLGGALILLLNPPLLSALHLVVAQIVGASVLYVCATLLFDPASYRDSSEKTQSSDLAIPPGSVAAIEKRRSRSVTILLFLFLLQIVLGAVSRHPPGKAAFIGALLAHMVLGVGIVISTIVIGTRTIRRTRSKRIRRTAWLLLALIAVQLVVAVPLTIVSPEPLSDDGPAPRSFPPVHSAHVLIATLLLTTTSVLRRRLSS